MVRYCPVFKFSILYEYIHHYCCCYCFFTLWWPPDTIDSLIQSVGNSDELYRIAIQSKEYKPVPSAHCYYFGWFRKLFQFLFPTHVSVFPLVEIHFGHQNDVNSTESSPRSIGISDRSIRRSLGIKIGRTMCRCPIFLF